MPARPLLQQAQSDFEAWPPPFTEGATLLVAECVYPSVSVTVIATLFTRELKWELTAPPAAADVVDCLR
jgi:hypothetical protein